VPARLLKKAFGKKPKTADHILAVVVIPACYDKAYCAIGRHVKLFTAKLSGALHGDFRQFEF
jgi:hypothetical protein